MGCISVMARGVTQLLYQVLLLELLYMLVSGCRERYHRGTLEMGSILCPATDILCDLEQVTQFPSLGPMEEMCLLWVLSDYL